MLITLPMHRLCWRKNDCFAGVWTAKTTCRMCQLCAASAEHLAAEVIDDPALSRCVSTAGTRSGSC